MFKEYKFNWILPFAFVVLSLLYELIRQHTLSCFCKSSWVSRWFDNPTLGTKPQTIWDRVTRLSSERKPALFLKKASHCTTPSWQKMAAAPFALIKVPTETYAFLFLAELRIEPSPFWTSEVLRFFSNCSNQDEGFNISHWLENLHYDLNAISLVVIRYMKYLKIIWRIRGSW